MKTHLHRKTKTRHGIEAECWVLNGTTVAELDSGGCMHSGNLSLWINHNAFDAGNELVDNCQFRVTAESALPEDALRAIMAAGPLQTSFSGDIDFSDAEIVSATRKKFNLAASRVKLTEVAPPAPPDSQSSALVEVLPATSWLMRILCWLFGMLQMKLVATPKAPKLPEK